MFHKIFSAPVLKIQGVIAVTLMWVCASDFKSCMTKFFLCDGQDAVRRAVLFADRFHYDAKLCTE